MAEVISIEMGAPIHFSKSAQAPSGTNAIGNKNLNFLYSPFGMLAGMDSVSDIGPK